MSKRKTSNAFKRGKALGSRKGYGSAMKKNSRNYGVGDFVLDVKTLGLWSVGRRIFSK